MVCLPIYVDFYFIFYSSNEKKKIVDETQICKLTHRRTYTFVYIEFSLKVVTINAHIRTRCEKIIL